MPTLLSVNVLPVFPLYQSQGMSIPKTVFLCYKWGEMGRQHTILALSLFFFNRTLFNYWFIMCYFFGVHKCLFLIIIPAADKRKYGCNIRRQIWFIWPRAVGFYSWVKNSETCLTNYPIYSFHKQLSNLRTIRFSVSLFDRARRVGPLTMPTYIVLVYVQGALAGLILWTKIV